MIALVSRRGPRVLLGRRVAGGLFGGLWEPPMLETSLAEDAGSSMGLFLGTGSIELCFLAEQTHVLTHRKLRIRVATADVGKDDFSDGRHTYEQLEWRDGSELATLGMSSVAKKVLSAYPGR